MRPATLLAVTPVRSGALIVGMALLLGACGGPDNTYVEERGSGLFVRLPADWEVFPVEDGKPAVNGRVDPDFGAWRVMIDGAERPHRAHGEQPLPDEPVGTVQVVPIELFQTPLPLAYSSLRSLFPAGTEDPLQDDTVTEVEYQEIELGENWGSRLVATIDLGAGPVRVAQLAFFDEDGKRVHLLRILCSVECFDDNEAEIEDILDSFTLEG